MDLGQDESPWGDEPSRSAPSQDLSKDEESSQTLDSSATTTKSTEGTTPRSSKGRGPRAVKRYGTQPTRLEAIDDASDPLGPLGDSFVAPVSEGPPAPPLKEQAGAGAPLPSVPRTTGPSSSATSSVRGLMESVNLNDDDETDIPSRGGARIPPPVSPPEAATSVRRKTQPSMSVAEAAKPSFYIIVGDPHKVGDLTGSHTVYQVRTKTTSKAYRVPEFEVSRRYRDFLWLYNQLHNNNPGIVVPPPPEKQALNRFDVDFVESRRQALERMLNKIAAHPILQHDGDLKLFLESEAFHVDIKHKERKDPGIPESKGVMASIGLSVGSGSKFIEHDDWFHDRKVYLDALENQLRALQKTTDMVVAQRKSLAESCLEFSTSLSSLSAVELSPSLSVPLAALADVQLRIQELCDRQAQQDVLTLGIVIDEYIRLIGSVKTAFQQRQKAYHSWHAAESELQKRRQSQDKLLRQGRSQQDKITQVQAEVADIERKVHQARLLFEDMGRLMRAELEKFEREKVEDFKSGVETYLESAVEAQKELIEIWETYLMQLDADEDGVPFGHPVVPAGVVAAPDKGTVGDDERPQSKDTGGSEEDDRRSASAALHDHDPDM